MLIDWFTVCAQLLNFVVLVWLLKRFLYKPILAAIDAREKRIADSLADADKTNADARKFADALQDKHREFDAARAQLWAAAEQEANSAQERLITEARLAADTLRDDRAIALRNGRTEWILQVKRLAASEVFAIARKVLADLASVNLEASIAEHFIAGLATLDPLTKGVMRDAFVSTGQGKVHSRMAISLQSQAALRTAINLTFSTQVALSFEVTPASICGIEVTANGQRIAWSVEDYLGSLEEHMSLLFDSEASAPASAVPAALPGLRQAPRQPPVALAS